MQNDPDKEMYFERKARRDPIVWVMLLLGLFCVWLMVVFIMMPHVDTESSYLGPLIGGLLGLVFVLMACESAVCLFYNASEGSYIDSDTGEFVWWNYELYYRSRGRDKKRIHPSQIGEIWILYDPDGPRDDQRGSIWDDIKIYSLEGVEQRYFGNGVVPKRPESWAREFVKKWPHIEIVIQRKY